MAAITANEEFITKTVVPEVGRNLLWLVWSGTISIANSILLWIFIARLRDETELGRFTIVMSLYALFYTVCSLGLLPFLVNEIGRRNAKADTDASLPKNEKTIVEFICTASTLLLVSGCVCAILMTISGFLVSEVRSVRLATLILSLAMIPSGVICVGESTAVAFGRTRLIAFISTLENVLRTVVPLCLIWLGFDISVLCISFVAVRFAALGVYLWAARHKVRHFAFSNVDFFKILNVVPTFGGTIIFAAINWQAAIILLGLFSTELESAKYGVASRFLIPVSILMASYVNVIQPTITRYSQKSIENAGFYLSEMVGYPLILSTLAAIVAPFLSASVLTLFFGEKYANVSLTLDILAISVVPFCVVMIVSRGLVAIDSQRIDFFANALGVGVCLAAGSILIPRYGAVGAATAQLFSFLSMAILETVYLSRKINSFRVWQKAVLASSSLLAAYLIIWKI